MRYILMFGYLIIMSTAIGQDTLTLNECFRQVENSRYTLILERSERLTASVNQDFHKWTLLPDLSASTTIGSGFGRRLDDVSNLFSTEQTNSQYIGISSSLTLFDGGDYFKRKKELQLLGNGSEVNHDQSLNALYSRVVSLYMDLCLGQSRITLISKRVIHFEQLLEIQRELFKAGKITQIDTLRVQNLMLKEQVEKTKAWEAFRRNEFQLNELMNVELSQKHVYDFTQLSSVTRREELDEIYSLKKNTISQELLDVERKLARSEIMPSLSMSGMLGARYSTNFIDPASAFGQPLPYADQLRTTFFQDVGFQLRIPIFNKGRYLKSNQLIKIREEQLLAEADFLQISLRRKQEEMELSFSGALIRKEQLEKSAENLRKVYKVTLELYRQGKVTFNELQEIFVEWQAELLTLEAANFELIRIELMRSE
ncbi:MAG: TolC family protein [Crocinitomicaceae bacterium]